jgi:DNA-binding beta-propeller fold protein YncE
MTRTNCIQRLSCLTVVSALTTLMCGLAAADEPGAFLPRLINSSTIPANGDVNPYGVALVPREFPTGGAIAAGDVLVSNFNNSANLQGTGTTIVSFDPRGNIAPPNSATVFYSSPLAGLSTALGVLKAGLVIVGNVPTMDGTNATIGVGALQVIDARGNWLQTLSDAQFLGSPWDLAIDDDGTTAHLFVSNVLNGTVVRLDVAVRSNGLTVLHKTLIGNGYAHAPNAAALVVGPTGLAFDAGSDTLYVASTDDNAIYAIQRAERATAPAGKGSLVFADWHLRGPLALRFAPNGNLLTANGDAINADPLHPSEIVEFTRWGRFVRDYNVDASEGGAFGLDVAADEATDFNFAVIDDVTNNLTVSHRR